MLASGREGVWGREFVKLARRMVIFEGESIWVPKLAGETSELGVLWPESKTTSVVPF